LKPDRTVIVRQSPEAINAGAFHNDVVCVGAADTLFFHEAAFENTEATLAELRSASAGLFELKPVMVPDSEVSLEDAIRSYLFNSQLLVMPGESRLVLIAPTEVQETDSTRAYCERLVERQRSDRSGSICRCTPIHAKWRRARLSAFAGRHDRR
jgi:succinylarginine dihydrolase